ncbi:MAG TPA: hypothetical protein VIS48_05895, partial [Candidatus Kryptonia bacterium]
TASSLNCRSYVFLFFSVSISSLLYEVVDLLHEVTGFSPCLQNGVRSTYKHPLAFSSSTNFHTGISREIFNFFPK